MRPSPDPGCSQRPLKLKCRCGRTPVVVAGLQGVTQLVARGHTSCALEAGARPLELDDGRFDLRGMFDSDVLIGCAIDLEETIAIAA